MDFLKTRKAAAMILVLSVLFGALYGSHRSLMAISDRITAQNENVVKDLQTRVGVGENLYTVAGRYMDAQNASLVDLRYDLDYITGDPADAAAYADLTSVIRGVLSQMDTIPSVSEQDRKYLSGFSAQLESGVDTIARDPYTALAEEFNTKTMRAFPAKILGPLTGVRELPVYQ